MRMLLLFAALGMAWFFTLFIALVCLLSPQSFAAVTDGQSVNAAITNAAFMDKNTATTFTIGKTDFQNVANAASGDGSIKSEGGGYITKDWWVNGFTKALGGIEYTSVTDSTSTGSNQNVTLNATFTVFTNASLTSIENFSFPNRANATVILIKNNTGGALTLKNLFGGVAANQINTGTGVDFSLGNGGGCQLIYDTVNSVWQLINIRISGEKTAIFTSTYTATTNDKYIFSNSTSGTTLTLPSAAVDGIVLYVKNINTGTLIINPVLSQTIDNQTAFGLNGQFQAIQLTSQGGNWWVY